MDIKFATLDKPINFSEINPGQCFSDFNQSIQNPLNLYIKVIPEFAVDDSEVTDAVNLETGVIKSFKPSSPVIFRPNAKIVFGY